MEYQYLKHDGFVFRRPKPKEPGVDPDTFYQMEIWDGVDWEKPMTTDIALTPTVYGREITEQEAYVIVDADIARHKAEGRG